MGTHYHNAPPYRILIVDDDKLTLAAEKAIFEINYNIVVANNGFEALEGVRLKL